MLKLQQQVFCQPSSESASGSYKIPTFLQYTLALEAVRPPQARKQVRVACTRNDDGTVTLKAVDGRSLRCLKGIAVVPASEFEARPTGALHVLDEARWALNRVGWSLLIDSVPNRPKPQPLKTVPCRIHA